ncbi:hypothetical protein PYW07_000743 [Mythimna separata]|uniref:Regulatory protein zeste n=1 Tax=Mythimna separata TaxID=271217 RepID=A0AAD8DLX7_MYTSE|nr:hypothetical protein PYW07_011070 [Mythimna separata]KAJ8706184.1 hypothetical protein PYW07_010961 [Mythimna separata]KAJ8708924.1 hypothetical protein PYW07_013528 [Mythimna separata]KAJ8726045.1 hypothetical protein PYW07_000743 [Mythimna separata]
MEQQKKKRGENWSPEEKEILRQLISQSAHIIEDKSTKTAVNILKIKEWKNLSNKFNEITGKKRSVEEIKLAWKRMKLSAKLNVSAHRREQARTGGGEKPQSPSAEDLQIMAIAPHDFVIEVNDYDSDAMIPITMVATETNNMLVVPKPGPSYEESGETNPKQTVVGAQAISNDIYEETGEIIIEKNPEQTVVGVQETAEILTNKETVDKRSPVKKTNKKILQNKNRSEEMRQTILESNTDFKKRQLEMMEIEHTYNIKIAQLKIRKMELEIAILENKKNSNTQE